MSRLCLLNFHLLLIRESETHLPDGICTSVTCFAYKACSDNQWYDLTMGVTKTCKWLNLKACIDTSKFVFLRCVSIGLQGSFKNLKTHENFRQITSWLWFISFICRFDLDKISQNYIRHLFIFCFIDTDIWHWI